MVTQIRVIAGKYGGRKIDAPDFSNSRTKPMGERIRNAMFNRIGEEIRGARVLDAFAGTGSVGLEALSRGASFVTFVERDKIAQKILQKNVLSLGAENESEIIRTTVNNWLETAEPEMYDIILADPPYHDLQLSTVSRLFGLLKPKGLMVLSHTGRGEGPNLENSIVVVDNRSYGNATLTSFRRE
ncbi:16S rRNA (guanine(966)-N(2))-methyltransferase RsmD [Candidatus Saccharibacteria bacterium oral taxon 955]|nr:16S rRNA (guanine(966)-N(2))-methyltransferase RsmD [Candidatus Saccharibacteria bacterium oral taxon 955]QJU05911.1 16S rRNA (guanine(966)-N(2))-methyltransferase RsmD [Candidatus Saccharibacteria bacterium oral taxon 955]QJU06733.1 16S rRNA (guanine(966)-N(2))-methyltransferase RsmD [Candidatus Saccharibacteria bacterium oral taxon 955]